MLLFVKPVKLTYRLFGSDCPETCCQAPPLGVAQVAAAPQPPEVNTCPDVPALPPTPTSPVTLIPPVVVSNFLLLS